MKNIFRGTGVALVTPFNNNGEIDFESLSKLVNHCIYGGVDFLVALGTTSESATLSDSERNAVLSHIVEINDNRLPILMGVGGNNTSLICSNINSIPKDIKGLLCVSPYYNKPTQEGLFQHFKLIAESVEIDQILYNVPGRTAVNMSVDVTSRLSEITNIIGIKDATGDLSVIKQLVEKCPKDFLLLTGDDATAVDFLIAGGHGGISVTANIVPKQLQKVYLAAIANHSELAIDLNIPLLNLHKNLFLEANPIPVKWALHMMGKCDNGIRLPLLELSKEFRPTIKKNLEELKLI